MINHVITVYYQMNCGFIMPEILSKSFLSEKTGLQSVVIGPLPLAQQALIPKNTWFAAQPLAAQADFTLVSCVVAPGFHFDDFELAERDVLIAEFPDHSEHITAYS